jgi:predicted RNA-binding protein Jag
MSIETQLALCSERFQRWKNEALIKTDSEQAKKSMKKAFFWKELQAAFIALHAIEQTNGKDNEVKKKLIYAKANLSKKLAEYAQETLDEMGIRSE